MAVESFVFYRSFMESIAEMRPKDQLATFWAIVRYALEDKEPELASAMTRAVFPVMRANLDANKQRRVNGKRGGRSKEPMVPPEETNGLEEENRRFAGSEPNETENETENVTETENETKTNTRGCADAPSKKRQTKFIPPTVAEVQEYCNEKGYRLDAGQFVEFYEASGWMRGKTKIKDWRACVRTWQKNESNRPQKPQPQIEILTAANWED
ncbi:MAG: DUF6291 domain-containing protein [Clostridiales bacterium]|nr:DUF6291 domain-containing protein [Clostridiales bacterium]